ncbi:MAG: T9SS type A sorting domain-containing protein [Chitinophagaceae bacterium]|nr:T9SS type A sorting domain-containing protein [Chitinophagaceae bacterium]
MRSACILLITFILSSTLNAQVKPLAASGSSGTKDLAQILNSDGSLRMANGNYNARGYHMRYADNGQPVFSKQDQSTVAGDENWDPNFAVPGVNGPVFTVLVDGTDVYVGGNFTLAGGIAVVNVAKWNGSVWSSLGTGLGGSTDVVTSIKKFGTSVYAGSTFGVSKWDGSTWTNIGTASVPVGPNLGVYAIELDGLGNLYAAGSFQKMNGVTTNCIAKWNGSTWSSLGNGLDINPGSSILTVAVQGFNVYAGGGFSSMSGVTVSNVACWNGSSWTNVGGGVTGTGAVACLAVVGTDLFVGGNGLTSAGAGVPISNVAKWNGSSWSSPGSGLNNSVSAFAVLGTELFAGGDITGSGATTINKIAHWNGSSWSNAGNGLVFSTVQALGVSTQCFFVGGYTANGALNMYHTARFDGSSWVVTGNGTNDYINCITISGNNIYVGGKFTEAGGLQVNRIARWNGSKWDSLGSGFVQGEVKDIAVIGSKVYAGGSFLVSAASGISYLAVWDGNTWSAVGGGVNYYVFTLTPSGNDLYVGGEFTTAGSLTCNYIAKWNGTAWSSLGTGMNGVVKDIKIAADGTLYAGGVFTIAGSTLVNRIAKWNGTAWTAMGSGVNGIVNVIELNSANEVYIGGQFDIAINANIVNHLAKFNGTAWVSVGGSVNSTGNVFSILSVGTDLYVGGDFTTAGTVAANNIAKWNGTSWSALGSGLGKDPTSYAIPMGLALNCSNLYAVGYFATAGDKRSDRFARYSLNGLPSITISTPSTNVCAGANVSFTATATNPGSTAVYQWQVNGVNAGTNSPTYSSSSLTNNSLVRCLLSGNAGCINPANATSNNLIITVNPAVTPAISINGNSSVNQGVPTLITATISNGGAAPVFVWEDSTSAHNWQTIAGATGISYSYTPAASGDKIRCRLTSNANCASPVTVVSNAVMFTVTIITAIDPVAGNKYGIHYFPNPAQRNIYIDSLKTSDQWSSAEIISLDGRKLSPLRSISGRTAFNMDIAFLPSGTYMLVLYSKKGTAAYLRFIRN